MKSTDLVPEKLQPVAERIASGVELRNTGVDMEDARVAAAHLGEQIRDVASWREAIAGRYRGAKARLLGETEIGRGWSIMVGVEGTSYENTCNQAIRIAQAFSVLGEGNSAPSEEFQRVLEDSGNQTQDQLIGALAAELDRRIGGASGEVPADRVHYSRSPQNKGLVAIKAALDREDVGDSLEDVMEELV